ncbi:AlbA family DNA-binding domain-containing protein [Adlercreutzia shanghongiae]|uniref:AlbA family DNA-binding domain-containing protein n=1 Tax=Adlercreutzia shanghongiae TaxID=3111773 RepID=UPI00389921B8
MHEGMSVEFKSEWSEGVKKTMVAFANTEGGTIYLGVSDDGEPLGLEDPDGCREGHAGGVKRHSPGHHLVHPSKHRRERRVHSRGN